MIKDNDIQEAHDLFQSRVDSTHGSHSGTTTLKDISIMCKACYSYSSDHMRELIDVHLKKTHIQADLVLYMYAQLIRALRIEGDEAGAKQVMEVDMVRAGIEPDDALRDFMCQSASSNRLNRLRQTQLNTYFKIGGEAACNAAQSLLNKLVSHQLEDVFHFTSMMK